MAIPGILKGLFLQTAVITAFSLVLGFYYLGEPGGQTGMASMVLLWPIQLAVHFDLPPVNPMNYGIEDYIYLSAFMQFVGVYVVMFLVHMTVKKKWSKNPRLEPNPDLEEARKKAEERRRAAEAPEIAPNALKYKKEPSPKAQASPPSDKK